MKKVLLLGLILTILTACVSSKKDYSAADHLINSQGFIEITPGYGLQDIHIGTSEKTVLQLLGKPYKKESLEGEKKKYAAMDGVNPRTFDTDFAYVYRWLEVDMHPIFKVYIKNGKVCEISFSAARFGSARSKIYRIKETTLTFDSDEDEIESQLGKREAFFDTDQTVSTRDPNAVSKMDRKIHFNISEDWEYYSKGMTVVTSRGNVIAIDVYSPIQ